MKKKLTEKTSKQTVSPVALVTGGARGLGKEIVLALAARGYRIVVNYRSGHERASETAKAAGNAVVIRADVRDAGDVASVAADIKSTFGRLDAVVNNAGVTRDNLLLKQTESEWDEVISTNLKGCFLVTQAMAPLMAESGGGHIINIASFSGVKGKAGQAAYSASKAALLGLTLTSARELAEYKIRVNAVLPGYLMTGMGMKAEKAMSRAREDSILKTLSRPSDVAAFIIYLLGTANITGQVFNLDSRVI